MKCIYLFAQNMMNVRYNIKNSYIRSAMQNFTQNELNYKYYYITCV